MYEKELQQRAEYLEKLINDFKKSISKYPKGNLRITKKKHSVQYYLVNDEYPVKGQYIKAEDRSKAEKLAQRDYLERLLKSAQNELQATRRYIKGIQETRPEDVFDNLNSYRQEIVEPLIISDSEYVKRWLQEQYEGNPYKPEEKIYDTNKGEKVRSKSEAFLANMYYEMGIPYRYEYPVVMSNGKVKYPDFTILKMPERKLIYHEHMGCLEEEEYRQHNLIKLNDYFKSGIYVGENLIVTFETSYVPLNISDVRKMINRIICPLVSIVNNEYN